MNYYVAGAEFMPSTHAAIITYAKNALLTAYPFVAGTANSKLVNYLFDGLGERPVIMDSGVFTLAGKYSAGGLPKKQADAYVTKYIKFIKESRYSGLIMDFDCHLLLPDWKVHLQEYRKRLYQEFGNRLVVIWHTSGGMDDWRYVTKTFDRVAYNSRGDINTIIKAMGMKAGNKVHALAAHKYLLRKAACDLNKKHCHVLGATTEYVFGMDDQYSCDSTTWSAIVRFGRAFPRTRFPVWWWRRDKLEAPKPVVEIVEAKMSELYKNYWKSPEASSSAPAPKYTLALAYALVASQLLADSYRTKWPPKNSDVNTAQPGRIKETNHA